MGYQVKWVEEHLGVTRKALRIYEEKSLMPKNEVVLVSLQSFIFYPSCGS